MTARTEANDARKAAELAWEVVTAAFKQGSGTIYLDSVEAAGHTEAVARRLESLARQEEALLSIGDKP